MTASVKLRQNIERLIVERIIRDILTDGKRIAVSGERGYDTEDMLLGSRDENAIMSAIFDLDECHLFVQPGDGPTVEDDQVISEGYVYLVFGNSGWDVVSDYTTNLESYLKGADEIADKVQAGDFKITL